MSTSADGELGLPDAPTVEGIIASLREEHAEVLKVLHAANRRATALARLIEGWDGYLAETARSGHDPDAHPFQAQPGCNVCICGEVRDHPWHSGASDGS